MNQNEQQVIEVIVKNLQEIVAHGGIVEARILRTSQGTLSGYFNDPYKLAKEIVPYNGKHDIYITINQINSALLARGINRLVPYAKQTTADSDVERRVWLLVDIDPDRPAGVSATDEEKEAALNMASTIKHYLVRECGWSEPIVADSGNGGHLLFPIDLPNDGKTREIISRVLQAICLLFNNDKAKVDLTTFNAARICKLYGTMATKGDHTAERPHRQSKIINYPDEQIPVPIEKLEALAGLLPIKPTLSKGVSKNTGSVIDINAYLAKHGVEVYSKSDWQGGNRWILTSCPWDPAHTDHSAYIVQFANGAVAAGCHHNGCSQESWYTFRDKLEPGWQDEKKIKKSNSNRSEEIKETHAEILIRIADVAELFHTSIEDGYATVPVGKRNRNMKIRSKNFKSWLTKEFYNKTSKPPGSDALNQAIDVIESKALYEGQEKKLHLRVAKYNDKFYYDLADKDGNVIEITPQGYKIADNPPDIFRRTKNMAAQVIPNKNGNVLLINKHVRSKTKDHEILFVVTVIASFVPEISHPVLVTAGEKGASKTTTMRMVRRIIDPAIRDLLVVPNSEYDLALVLANNYAPSFDNIESISPKQSNMLCMASTGGGVSVRTLYTNDEETFLEFKHCVGLNGINVVATRPDLLDRAVINELERIPQNQRKEESAVWQAFDEDLPLIMGGIFEILSKALNIYPTVSLSFLPRMADYCRWGYAIAEAIGYGGKAFLDAYNRNISRANDSAIKEDQVAAAVVAFMREHTHWEGYVAKLLMQLERVADDEKINIKAYRWPKAAHSLSSRLNEVKSNLEEIGISFEKKHDKGGTVIRLENAAYVNHTSNLKGQIVGNRQNYDEPLMDAG